MGFFVLSGALISAPAAGAAQEPALPAYPAYTVTLTGYNAVPEQTDADPFTTASGAFANPEVVAARSQDLAEALPFGTVVAIGGPDFAQKDCGWSVVGGTVGYRVIVDAMNKRFTSRVDILFPNTAQPHNRALVLGVCKGASIKVVGRIDPADMPATQAELARMIEGAQGVAFK